MDDAETAGKKKGCTIPSDGLVPVFLLDESQVVVSGATQSTTVGAVCLSLRAHLGLDYDAHFALFQWNCTDGGFVHLDDQLAVATLVAKWPQSSFDEGETGVLLLKHLPDLHLGHSPLTCPGPYRLCYKRCMHVPNSRTEEEILAATSADAAPLRLAYAECVFSVRNGNYRFDAAMLIQLAALQLQSVRGDYEDARDSAAAILYVEGRSERRGARAFFTAASVRTAGPSFTSLFRCTR